MCVYFHHYSYIPAEKPHTVQMHRQQGMLKPCKSQKQTVPNVEGVMSVVGQHERVDQAYKEIKKRKKTNYKKYYYNKKKKKEKRKKENNNNNTTIKIKNKIK